MPFLNRRVAIATVLCLSTTTATAYNAALAQTTPPVPATPPAAAPVVPTAPTTPTTAAPVTAPPATGVDAAAKATLMQIVAAQQALTSYAATEVLTAQSGTQSETINATIVYAKPNKVVVHASSGANSATYTSDGKDNYFFADKATTYTKSPAVADANNIGRAIAEGHATILGILPLMIAKPNAADVILEHSTIAKLADDTLDGVAVDVIQTVTTGAGGAGFTATFSAGKDDHLLRRLSITQGANTKVTELYTAVKANPTLLDTTFAFMPKPGMKLAVAAPEQPMFDSRIKVGAMPLPFSGMDTNGKLQTLTAYKGKVVLLDFWATWCGPCRAELPNVVAAYDKYHAAGFSIVGVSLDQAGDKAKLLSFTKENKMPWPQIYDGKYWQSDLAKKYGVVAIPFSVLVGKDGKIIAVNPRGEELEPAVKMALTK